MYNLFSFTQSFMVLLFPLQLLFCWNWALKDHQDLLVPRSYSFFSVLALFDFHVIVDTLTTNSLWLCPLLSPRITPTSTHTHHHPCNYHGYSCVWSSSLLSLHSPWYHIPSQNSYLISSEKIIFKYKLLFMTSSLLYLDLCIQVAWLKTKLIL